jgi:hypothetical protein
VSRVLLCSLPPSHPAEERARIRYIAAHHEVLQLKSLQKCKKWSILKLQVG